MERVIHLSVALVCQTRVVNRTFTELQSTPHFITTQVPLAPLNSEFPVLLPDLKNQCKSRADGRMTGAQNNVRVYGRV